MLLDKDVDPDDEIVDDVQAAAIPLVSQNPVITSSETREEIDAITE